MSPLKLLLLLFLIQISPKSYGHEPQEGKIVATMGPFLQNTYVPASAPVSSPYSMGLGLLAEGDLDEKGGVELGIFYMRKTYFQNIHGDFFGERVRRIHITTGYRFWWNNRISTGLAFYSSYSMGDPDLIYRAPNSPYDPLTSASRSVKYGLDLSMQWEFSVYDELIFLLDARLSRPFIPMAGEHSNHYGLLVGTKYEIKP